MVDLSNYPYPTYEPNKAAAGVLAAIIGLSTIGWLVQSIQTGFERRRPLILILVSHLTVFVHLILRAALSTENRNSRIGFTILTVLIAVGLRTIILANYDFLTQVIVLKPWLSRSIVVGSMLAAIGSAVLMVPAGTLSYSADTIDSSFRLRQASSAMVLIMTVVFYPIWIFTKTLRHMTKLAILLLIISSISCLVVAVYLVITSVADYYVSSNEQEYWFYIFQFTPIAIALLSWTILHLKRSLGPIKQSSSEENVQVHISENL